MCSDIRGLVFTHSRQEHGGRIRVMYASVGMCDALIDRVGWLKQRTS